MSPAPPVPEAHRLEAVRALGLQGSGPDERFDRIARLAARVLGTPIAALSLIDADTQWFKAAIGMDEPSLPRTMSFCSTVVEQAAPLVVADLAADGRFGTNPLVEDGLRFYVGVPLRAPGGEVVGSLCAIDRVPRELPPGGLDALLDLAAVAESELAAREIAHEVRTPIAAILGYAEELLEAGDAPLEAHREEAASAIVRNARRLRKLADRVQSGAQPGGVKR